ncbi:MAG: hypothetical protein JWO39_1995 [Gemmatimonadetes bacterium]|jgi:hypothetical protein|nr:hypothetical protein [Gemmatimonadota bacterium]
MSESSPVRGAVIEPSASSKRRTWVAPTLAPHSTLTVLTQSALPPLSLLFLQASIQCFNHNGNPVPCP